jgi:sulfur carrier protein ThiS
MFQERRAILGTMHGKERVIAPILEQEIGLKVIVPDHFDSDKFGTFTRDIKRISTQIETARRKAQQAIELSGYDIGIASEGSFYPYPNLPIVSCNRELILLCDRVHNLEIIGQAIVTETNHAHQTVINLSDALEFAEKVGFPAHGLVVMVDKNSLNSEEIFKGITNEADLVKIVKDILDKNGTVHLETDMRAMHNPTRMKAIVAATENLVQKLKQLCPNCGCPGFDIVERKGGLPCSLCHFPTSLIKLDIYGCQKCDYREEKIFPNGQATADPMYCEYCNP